MINGDEAVEGSNGNKRPRINSRSTIACNALAIVLQHWLLLSDVGILSSLEFENHLPVLRESIIKHSESVLAITAGPERIGAEEKLNNQMINDWQSTTPSNDDCIMIRIEVEEPTWTETIPFGAINNVSNVHKISLGHT